MTAVAPEDQPLRGRKRGRGTIEDFSTTGPISPQPPWKMGQEAFSITAGTKHSVLGLILKLVPHSTRLEGIDPRGQGSSGRFDPQRTDREMAPDHV